LSDTAARLFHLAAPGDWLPGAGHAPASLAREGFVHLSFAHQLEGTLRVHFAAARELELVELDPAAVADALRLEPSRGGEEFPHLYRALAAADELRRWTLVRGASGQFALPPGVPGRS
jgi:uncharacterized protein (DUF952 family)